MKKTLRILCVLLVLAMLIPAFGLSAFAANPGKPLIKEFQICDRGGGGGTGGTSYSFTVEYNPYCATGIRSGNTFEIYPKPGYSYKSYSFLTGSGSVSVSGTGLPGGTLLTINSCTPGSVITINYTYKEPGNDPPHFGTPPELDL